ncbi:Eukaryotic translation initiation factor 2B, subunit 4 delta, 67kDa [Coelomomyces lativittatus]|nr:Eukaryotic translation initiation factor 2B, subunit 4 delta, 67kDa [Coelomomyces lativittatus]KAJ1512019.1 Eukaryotic translation initiation factor 2B, subunit 4 delta, 67kDa [Coelomomyces lativittatus]KAJ1516124.1 Eukaryotic translation initiation factor 2B, subunit 4 delta, 67kDa [Coelomomyces lativittatus]
MHAKEPSFLSTTSSSMMSSDLASSRPPKKSMKEMTKAERREYQEAQRRAKLIPSSCSSASSASPLNTSKHPSMSSSSSSSSTTPVVPPPPPPTALATPTTTPPVPLMTSVSSTQPTTTATTTTTTTTIPMTPLPSGTVSLFSHLPPAPTSLTQLSTTTTTTTTTMGGGGGGTGPDLHPAIVQLGYQLGAFQISGANARCLSMLEAFKKMIQEYQTPPNMVLSRHLTQYLSQHIAFLSDIRPLAASMGNAIRQLKHQISKIGLELPDIDAKESLIRHIDEYIHERITMAIQVLSEFGATKIHDQDVILTYGSSSTVKYMLTTVHQKKKIPFRVIVVTSRPKMEGVKMAHDLHAVGIQCTLVPMTALSYIMPNVRKVLLGSHALLCNGALVSRVGTSQVAMIAHYFNVPVIVACETYKFSLSIHLDSIVFNEMGNLQEWIQHTPLHHVDWKQIPHLRPLHLLFDVTPPQFITVVITELGLVPASSVPVIIREYKPLLSNT